MVLFDVSARVEAVALAKRLREKGIPVLFQRRHRTPKMDDYLQMAVRRGMDRMIYVYDDGKRGLVYALPEMEAVQEVDVPEIDG